MLSLSIPEPHVKSFMNRLLRESLFDAFEIRGAEVAARTRISVSGAIEDEAGGFVKWAEIKPLITEIVKTGGRPRYMKIIFSADSGVVGTIHENAQALFLNLVYENNGVTFTTASAQKQFALDKSLDTQWDEHIMKFFAEGKIEVSERM